MESHTHTHTHTEDERRAGWRRGMYRWRGNSRREPWRYEDEEAQRMGREMMEMWKELSKWRWRDVGVEVWRCVCVCGAYPLKVSRDRSLLVGAGWVGRIVSVAVSTVLPGVPSSWRGGCVGRGG